MRIVDNDIASLQYFPELLTCVARALEADSREGGQWCRTEDRYNQLMEPLTKLLFGKYPAGFFTSDVSTDKKRQVDNGGMVSTSYYRLVVNNTVSATANDNSINDNAAGTDYSSVVDCLVALASAAGDENLWKPLNHDILQACGHDDRSEVQRAGVTCLLRFIRTLGEEFMVLIPECLPYLAELLESSDEETAGLAQECVRVSENFLGESLEDSLR